MQMIINWGKIKSGRLSSQQMIWKQGVCNGVQLQRDPCNIECEEVCSQNSLSQNVKRKWIIYYQESGRINDDIDDNQQRKEVDSDTDRKEE